jgi:hypothetical protein
MVEIWLSYVLTEQDHRLVAVRAWANDRREMFNRALDRLGWSIYLTNTTSQHYDVPSLL